MNTTLKKKLDSPPRREAAFIEPMECALVPNVPDGSQWVYEIKLDGYRAVAVKSAHKLALFSRRRKSFNRQFPYIADALGDLPDSTVIDGEIVALDESGHPNFNMLQSFRATASHIHHFVFDLLVYQNRDLTRLPLIERRGIMQSALRFRTPRIRNPGTAAPTRDARMPIHQSPRDAAIALGRRSKPPKT